MALALAACSADDRRGDFWDSSVRPPPPSATKPQRVEISLLRILDAAGQPLAGMRVIVDAVGAEGGGAPPALTDAHGELAVTPLAAGSYRVQLLAETTAATVLTVAADNARTAAPVALPVLLTRAGSVRAVDGDGFVASVSGLVYDARGPVAGAQVGISAGSFSNGAIASAVTDSAGAYSLVLNVGAAVAPAMGEVSVRVIAAEYQTLSLSRLDISQWGAVAGFNQRLMPGRALGEVVYHASFDRPAEGAVCGDWTGEELHPSGLGNLWHSHGAGRAIDNGAVAGGRVSLAPDDHSDGYVPEPPGGEACWYGSGTAEGVGRGNFLGAARVEAPAEFLDGGTSAGAHAAAIISPWIDLTAETAPLALTFQTWWEIEAVNPNEDGLDLMSIEVRLDGEQAWRKLARLNPLSDPQVLTADVPYSNRGFNRAPAWLWQEPIALDRFAGRRLQLRFGFHTLDERYNGFRGWLVDDVRIIRQPGSFPLWQEPRPDVGSGDD